MATKFRRDKIWYVKYKDVDGLWKNISCGKSAKEYDAEQVRKKYDSMELNRRHDMPIRRIDMNLIDAMEDFKKGDLIKCSLGRQKSHRSKRREQVCIENFQKWIELKNFISFPQMKNETIKQYFDYIADKSPRSRHEERRVLKKFFDWAIEKNYCQKNPVLSIVNPKPEKKHPRFFYDEELKKIFNHAFSPYDDIFKFLYLTGMRIGELANAEWKDVVWERSMLIVPVQEGSKTKRETIIHLSKNALQILKHKKEEAETIKNKINIFVNSEGNKLDNDNIYRNLKRTMKRAEVTNGSPHTLRHTCASHLVISGVSLYIVKEILRHASIKETEIYAHLSNEAVRNAVEFLKI